MKRTERDEGKERKGVYVTFLSQCLARCCCRSDKTEKKSKKELKRLKGKEGNVRYVSFSMSRPLLLPSFF